MKHKKLYLSFLIFAVLMPGVVLGSAKFREAPKLPSSYQHQEASSSKEIYIPAGEFVRGCAVDQVGDLGCSIESSPLGVIYLDAFYIDETEVTTEQYERCVEADVCEPPTTRRSTLRLEYYGNPQFANYPVIHVNWERANTYCQWMGKRLPTEAEWEKAARGTDRRWFPWGNDEPGCALLNCAGCIGDTTPVGSYPEGASPYGVLDMSGNVREWVSDLYDKHYFRDAPYYNPQGPAGTVTNEHLVRGGSWNDVKTHFHTWGRLDEHDIYETHLIGFRCARSAPGRPPPTPTPTPMPTPTPLPAASADIGTEGGALWIAYPQHLTLLTFPENTLSTPTTVSVTYRSNLPAAGSKGNDHFFAIQAQSQSFEKPIRLTVAYHELLGVEPDTLDLYRLTTNGWITDHITKVTHKHDHIIAEITEFGIYGLLGETNRTYLPLVTRQ